MTAHQLDYDLANTAGKLFGCSSLLFLLFRQNRENRVVALGALTTFLFFAFRLADHYDMINRPLWSDVLVLVLAVFVFCLAVFDVIQWAISRASLARRGARVSGD